MATAIFTMKEYAAHMAKLGASFGPAARRGLVEAAQAAIPILVSAGDNAPPASEHGGVGARNSGAYRGAWNTTTLPDRVVITNGMSYSGVIEYGRRPGRMPPAVVMARWAQRRLGLSEKEAQGAGFAIARSIAKRGLLPRKVLESSMPRIREIARKSIDNAIKQLLSKGAV